MFSQTVNKVKIKASDGWPVFVEVTVPHDGHRIRLQGSSDLRDLQYAVQRTLEFVEAEEKRGGLSATPSQGA